LKCAGKREAEGGDYQIAKRGVENEMEGPMGKTEKLREGLGQNVG